MTEVRCGSPRHRVNGPGTTIITNQGDHDRMTEHIPRPALCPKCGLAADNGIFVRSELTTTATYCCTAGHLYAVTWVEGI